MRVVGPIASDGRKQVVLAAVSRDHDITVLHEARRHAVALGSELLVCHVVHEQRSVERADEQLRARASAALGIAARDLNVVIAVGDPADEIRRVARECSADLVVIGPASHGRLLGLLRGCTLTRVLRGAAIPVLVARESPHTNRIVVATDLVDPAFPVIRAAERESRAFDAEVVALHAIEPLPLYGTHLGKSGAWLERMPMRYRVWLQRARENLDLALRRTQLRAEAQVMLGATKSTVMTAAEQVGAELLVIGLHQKRLRDRFAARNVARPIIRCAPCSVFVVPLPGPEPAS